MLPEVVPPTTPIDVGFAYLVRQYIRGYLEPAGLTRREHARAPLFQSAPGSTSKLSGRPLDRSSVLSL